MALSGINFNKLVYSFPSHRVGGKPISSAQPLHSKSLHPVLQRHTAKFPQENKSCSPVQCGKISHFSSPKIKNVCVTLNTQRPMNYSDRPKWICTHLLFLFLLFIIVPKYQALNRDHPGMHWPRHSYPTNY